MKASYFILVYIITLLGYSISTQGQAIRKVHAYKQASLPGIYPVIVDTKGNEIQPEYKPSYNYWFYLEIPKSEKIIIADIWIEGKRFSVKSEPITKTPYKKVIHTGAIPPDTVVIVPKTPNRVIFFYPSGSLKDSMGGSRYLAGLVRDNELVIGYFRKGKKYFKAVRMITSLPPEARV